MAAQKDALMELLSPDGYYTYLKLDKATIVKPPPSTDDGGKTPPPASNMSGSNNKAGEIDADAVKKAYRKLSRLHHPDKGGDAETFKVLARAHRVLLDPKLREQYDILGIDLDDDNEHTDDGKPQDGNEGGGAAKSTAEGIVQEIASMILTGIIQLAIRTALLGIVTVLLVRYRWTFYPMLLFLGYVSLQIVGRASLRGGSVYETDGTRTPMSDVVNPFLIAVGLVLMRSGRDETMEWSWIFWLGEAMVICLFTLNTVDSIPRNAFGIGAVCAASGLMALWFRGKFWNYALVIGFEVFMALFIALAFPVMEMLLESILNEKLKKVGEKIRAHHRHMAQHYSNKLENKES